MGLPGSPNIAFSIFLNLANKIGLPGLIKTPLKKFDKLNFFTIEGTKSYFPAETAPEVIIISIFDLILLTICFLKNNSSLSLKIPPSIKLNKKLLNHEQKYIAKALGLVHSCT